MASVKKPKQKGKHRIFVGECFGMTTSPKIVRTWSKAWRSVFPVGGKIANYLVKEKKS